MQESKQCWQRAVAVIGVLLALPAVSAIAEEKAEQIHRDAARLAQIK